MVAASMQGTNEDGDEDGDGDGDGDGFHEVHEVYAFYLPSPIA